MKNVIKTVLACGLSALSLWWMVHSIFVMGRVHHGYYPVTLCLIQVLYTVIASAIALILLCIAMEEKP